VVVIDNGTESIEHLLPSTRAITTTRRPAPKLGELRKPPARAKLRAAEDHRPWDDDDWYPPGSLRRR